MIRTLRFLPAALMAGLIFGGIGQAQAGSIYVIATGVAANDNAAVNLLTDHGESVTLGQAFNQFDGSGLNGSYRAVVFLQNQNGLGEPLGTAGQTALLNFVSAGGGLVTSEWTAWGNQVEGYNPLLAPAIPVTATGAFDYVSPLTYTQATADPVLNGGLPSSFTFNADNNGGTEAVIAPKIGATTYYTSSGGDSSNGLVGWDYLSGRVISFSTLAGAVELGNANYGQLFVNAVDWAENDTVTVIPEPSTLVMWSLLASVIGITWLKQRNGIPVAV